jgi:hypothetical protein
MLFFFLNPYCRIEVVQRLQEAVISFGMDFVYKWFILSFSLSFFCASDTNFI